MSKDIYHQNEPPALARKRRNWPSLKRNEVDRPSEAAAVGVGPTLRMQNVTRPDELRRRRRRPSDHSPQVALLNRLTWMAVSVVALGYIAILIGMEYWMRRPPPTAPQPAPEAVISSAPVEAPAASDGIPLTERMAHWKQGLRVLSELTGRLEKAPLAESQKTLEQVLQEVPDLTRARFELARILERQKKFEEARTLLLEVLDNDPELVVARLALGRTFLSLGQSSEALTMAQWIIETDPYSTEAQELAATALLNLNNPTEAITHLRRLANLNRDDLTVLNNLGAAYLKVNDFRSALQTFREVLRADADNSVTYYNLAMTFARQGLVVDAVDTLSKAAQMFGTSFVSTWTQGVDFDPIRDDPAFQRFMAGTPPPPTPATAQPETNSTSASTP